MMHVYGKFTDIYSYIKTILFLAVLLTVGATEAWAQTPIEVTADDDSSGAIEASEKKLYLIQTNAFQSFYMAPQANNTITTNNIFGDYMLWYFLDAGTDNGTQYYYIVNNSTGKYICHGGGTANNDTSRGVTLVDKTASNDERCKFYLNEDNNNGTIGFYNIDAKGKPSYYGLNKRNGSETNQYPIRLTNDQYIHDSNSKWKFIRFNGTYSWPATPFTVSTTDQKYYLKIHNLQNGTYYVSTNASSPKNATISTTTSDDMVWYFEEAGSDTWFKYYYIVNPETGQYMYYNGTKTDGKDQTDPVVILKDKAVENEDRFQFVVVQAAKGNWDVDKNTDTRKECYAIIPKLLCDKIWGSNSIGTKTISNGANMGIINSRGSNNNAQWTFEVVDDYLTAPAISFDNSTKKFTITSPDGGTIYYTTNGDAPTSSSNEYTTSFALTEGMTEIKAVAIISPAKITPVATKQINTYTFKIVNKSYKVAVIKTENLPEGTSLTSYTDIPAEIRSDYLEGETVYFRSFAGEENVDDVVTQATLNDHDVISQTPAGDANIYVTYTTDKLGERNLKLRGARSFNLKNGSSEYFVNSSGTTLTYDEVNTETTPSNQNKNKDHIWYISGGDPYAVTITCSATNNYLTSAPSVATTENIFFVKAESGSTVTFQDASGTIAVTYNEVKIPTSYYLIDKTNKILLGPEVSTSSSIAIPSEWYSPLAEYHYYKSSSFDEAEGVYTLNEGQTELGGLEQLGEGEHIYITYDVKDDVDLDGRNLLNAENKVGKTYRLEFSGGESFNQEDGKDGVMTETRKAVYPYSNGDAALYVYGNARWEEQLANGASTRTRWLWYIEPTKNVLDPYHVKISSYQTQTSYKIDDDNTRNFHSYLKTYKPIGHNAIVTGVTNDNPLVKGKAKDADADNSDATEYMILGTSLSSLKLVTLEAISDGTTTERRTVNSFEQYWKNNPTVQGKLTTKVTAVGRDVTLTETQKGQLPTGWHAYSAWANSQPWVHNNDGGGGVAHTTSKKFKNEEHVFQTVSMGDGSFKLIETEIKPMLILLDQHGWEIVRLPLPTGDPTTLTAAQQLERKKAYANLHKYSSPMVEKYRFWKTGSKVEGYHKFKVSDPATEADGVTIFTTDELGRADITNPATPPNLPDYNTQALASGKERDWYVTYDVKAEYAGKYAGAATKGATSAAPYLIKQNGVYAQYSGSGTSISTTPTEPDIKNVPEGMQWYVRPNFDIDEEMGYNYNGAYEEKSKDDTEADYVNGVTPQWSNGFDPYNVQIQNVATPTRYFTANTSSSTLTSRWSGSSSGISLLNMGVQQSGIIGFDQTKMKITNATFMVVADDKGNMRLMPRFDNSKVMQSFTSLASPAKEGTDSIAQILTLTPVPKIVSSSSEIKAMGGYYMLDYPFDASSGPIGTKTAPFKGTIEGQIDHSFSVSAPFIAYTDGDATIKNVIIESASFSSGNEDGHAGAIVASAKGNTHIYNCGVNGGEISGSNYTGGIVGLLDDYSRVINCYSYAKITGGSDVGGIVGHNDYLTTASNLRTMVMNCAFYGDITGGSKKSPVYGGYNIDNVHGGLNNYNYYAYAQLPTDHITNDKYNTALAVADEDFKRFEFYRLLLNGNRRLAAYYITGRATDADIMAKWVLETADRSNDAPKPYPVLKEQDYYPSIINYDVEHAPDSVSVGRNHGGKLGKTLNVHISGKGITSQTLEIERTDKDFDRYNFNYDKIQLPYYNDYGTENYKNYQVVTGWEITSMTGGTAGTYETGDKWNGYNFADRKCTNKDITGTGGSGRIFSQGAYFDVPYGVTDIYIQPHWATAAYVADEYLDVVYNNGFAKHAVTELGNSFKQFPTGKITLNGSEQTVHKTIDSAIATFDKGSVYDYAVVLVGNLHQDNVPLSTDAKRFTMMSVDQDNDHEPDYSMIYHHTNRTSVCPIRFDFLNVIGTSFAQKPNGANLLKNTTIFRTRGWFEVTNTALMYSNQMEYENLQDNTKEDAPLILLGGKFDQFVSTQRTAVNGKTIYIHVGGNVWIDQFGLGTHSDGSKSTPHVPVSVTGGEYKGFYLTGTYNQDAEVRKDNAECYISGGHFVEAAGACQEQIDGDVRWQIYNADIDAFYGGGINNAKPITGDVTTEIFNSYVTTFCGGPKFGDMQTDKDVRTTATGCVFEKYFGAGYGGTSYSRKKYFDATSYNFNNLQTNYTNDRGKYFDGAGTKLSSDYGYKGIGVATDFDYEFFVWSTGQTGARFFVKFASFSLANCINVYSTLNKCTVNQNFYGGGSFGSVSGTANSVLNDCMIHGNVFGGGYSAQREKVPVRDAGFDKLPKFNSNTGMFEAGTFSGTTPFEWKHISEMPANGSTEGSDLTNHYIYTDVDLDALGKVGNTVLTIQGETVVEGKIFQYDDNGKVVKDGNGDNVVVETTGGVFGGGDMSDVNHDTQVTIEATDATNGVLNVFGGGNVASVGGSTEVNVNNGTVQNGVYGGCNAQGTIGGNTTVTLTGGTVGTNWGDAVPSTLPDRVFGGGLGEPTLVSGDVTVNVGTKSTDAIPVYAGNVTVWGNVYGGSALGNTNATRPAEDLVVNPTKKTEVYLYGGTIHGDAYGGGLGRKAKDAVAADPENNIEEQSAVSAVESFVGGDVLVLLDGAKVQQVFGCNNLNGTPKGHVKVWVKRTVGSDKSSAEALAKTRDERAAYANTNAYDVAAVYGGGNQADYIPTKASGSDSERQEAFAQVLIDGCDQTSIEYVYGGGNAAAVPATDVTILGDYIINYVFGGGNGKSTQTFTNPGANIGTYNNGATEYGTGKAVTKLVGGHIMYVFGGSDTKGNVRGGTTLSMPDQSTYPAPTYDCCNVRDVKEIYGAGNEAEQDGDVTLIMGCVSNMDYVYGGARNAHVKGGVDLVVTSGHFKGVFGGNNIAGTIQGPIKVTIEETGCDPLIIDSLYLGGNQAAYSVYGYKDVEGTLVARTSMTDGTAVNPPVDDAGSDDITEKQLYRDPVLNIVSCTSIGNAFGGGLGTGAVMYGSPTVNVNMIPGDYAKYIDRDGTSGADNDSTALGEIGNVYGGGEEANVEGNTTVNIVTEETVTVRSHMGSPVATPSPTEVKGALITGNVFGAGKGNAGDVDLAFVTGNTTINMKGGEVKKSIYGGGELSQIGGDSHITVSGGTIGTTGQGGAMYGNVYGGGLGQITNALFGLVKGNTNISIKDNASILHNIYGGGAYGSVGTYTFSNGVTTCADSTGTANITVTGGTIGTDGHENGMVFGSSRGDVAKPTGSPALDPNDHLAWVNATNVVVGTAGEGTTITTPLIKGSVYGSGENGHTYHDTNVTIHSGTIGITDTDIDGGAAYAFRGNVYGGGCGTDMYDSDDEDTEKDTYNPLSGIVKGNATVLIDGGHVVHNVYGAGAMGSVEGNASVTITGDAHIGVDGSAHANGYVYAAAKGDEALDDAHQAYVGSTTLNISGGTVWGDAFGGGQSGIVKGAVAVNLTGGTLKQDVYGGGALAKTNTMYDGSNETYKTYVTNVVLNGSTVLGNVYGGGLGRKEAVAANVNGPVTVTVTGGKAANVFGCNNLYGAPQQTVAVTVNGTTVPVMPATYAIDNVYGGGNQAAYTGTPTVTMAGGYVNNIYGGGLGSTAIINGGTTVAINGGTVTNDVFGGGSQADVTGSVNVSITGGTVVNDVYGGGALADTNTGNWDASVWKALTPIADGGTIKADVTCVTGLYTSMDDGTLITTPDTRATAATTYYQKGNWAAGKNEDNKTTYKTIVTLTGGIVGNAYGGGLGRQAAADDPATLDVDESVTAVAANVYGDVFVTLGDKTISGIQATGFIQTFETPTGESEKNKVPLTGRLFGANNLNGTPMGNVSVTVYETQQLNADNAPISGHSDSRYDMHSVYGGGNLSRYMPADGKQTTVLIDGCDEASIEKVFGGGNSAAVPSTMVVILGSYKIGYAFGGGNGADKIKKGNAWYENDGAPIYGDATVYLVGGKIGQAFSGSDTKGTVYGSSTTKLKGKDDIGDYKSDCPLKVTHSYGAGRGADINGNVNFIVSGCTKDDEIETVFGGSYDANIRGNVTLTITSGIFTSVFGGNDHGGTIGGDITVNIEETEECNPIIIQYLYGGGREAAYPGTGAKKYISEDKYENVTNGNITVNVKSATRIGTVYGGGDRALVNGNSTVNVNMIKGVWAGKVEDVSIPRNDITAETTEADIENVIPNIDVTAIDKVRKTITFRVKDEIGTIGNVYGGSFQNVLNGNSTVNIGTETGIKVLKRDGSNQILATDGNLLYDNEGKVRSGAVPDSTNVINVLGAHITGNVFGGSNAANVTGNSTVNICTADYSGTAGFKGVNIDNGSVYGGGNAGDVLGNTNVTMAGGYVYDGVYGGGLHGSVGTFTRTLPSGHPAHAGCIGGKPDVFTPNTGKCTVVVSGGQVGPVEVATEGMKKAGGPIHKGFVFGAGRGDVENPADDPDADFQTYVYETDVTIKNTYKEDYESAADSVSHIAAKPLIMASVYGGGENGRVRGNTFVKIYGGQIGCGEGKVEAGKPVAYDEADFIDPTTSTASAIIAKAAEMKECAHWDYGRDKNGQKEYLPYDPYAAASDLDDDIVGSDGHTYYGSVFGGGSGYYPYRRGDGTHEWLRSAGLVEGNTKVHISGGHILTNVYGGNELTDVNGSCTVTMTGGTIGIPRTLAGIADHPVTCYLFGAGKGDQRTHFNQWTDVDSTNVTVSGGIIYGSVFGGGEDGHVTGDAVVTIQGTAKIGTWGTSYVDGNIFGGGRGFSGEALTAGNVGGNVDVNISGGTMLGSVYGGGRLASVGYQLVQPESEYYGKLQDGTDHGYVNINISGGTIGNPHEFIIPSTADNAACGIAQADITQWTADDWTKWKTYKNIPYTEFAFDKDINLYRLSHTKGGNVYAGGMGRLDNLNGTPLAGWKGLGKVKNTTLNITGGNIKGNVYGGGEMGLVGDIPAGAVAYAEQPVVSTVTIMGGTIGTEVQSASVTQYTFGSVFGGGYGNTREKINPAVEDIPKDESDNPKFMSGRTHGSTQVSMSAGTVLGSIYGGGEVANVRGNARVAVSGGTVGKDKVGEKYFSGATMGNVFGGGSGTRTIVRCGQVFGNTSVEISETDPGTPTHIYNNIYGGGSYGSVGDINWTEAPDPNYGNAYKTTGVDGISTAGTGTATVRVTGGTIGVDGLENGFVFGSSRGEVADPAPRDNLMAWTYATNVTIGTIGTSGSGTVTSTPLVKGSVYGGGENGHVWNATDVKVYSGTIGDPTSFVVNRGNVFGAGRGIEKVDSDDPDAYNPEAGIVKGSTQVLIAGGQVSHNVYGAGAMGSVVGSTSVTVDGDAIIGDNLDNGTDDGNVFGAARGDIALNSPLNLAYVGSTTVTIAGGLVKNDVFGGGEAGVVKGSVVVNMNGGTVGKNLYGGGALSNTNTNNVTENYGADTGYTNPTETIPTTNTNTTAVNLLGGTIQGNAYGGGLGRRPLDAVGTPGDPGYKPAVAAIFAKVYGDVTVDLNNNNNGGQADGSKAGCAVTKVFGCNDMHGTPRGHVKVHVFATQHPNRTELATISSKYPLYANIDDYTISNYAGLTTLAATVGADVSAYTAILTDPAKDDDAKKAALADMREAISRKKYDVQAVYGGGDLARYEPVNAFSTDEAVRQSARVEVIIDGCALTSINEAYGSGNASATPASSLTVYGCHEIDELFGGGNGKDPYQLDDGYWYANPGANVGYRNFTHYVKDGTHGDGSKETPYTAVENTDATSKEYRIANYAYGSGEAHTDVFGGRIHSAYGGSNMVGNIRYLAMSSYDSSTDCPSNIDHTYAGGNEADMDGKAELLAKCVGYMHKLYGGNTKSDYNNDIVMTITNGVFGTVIGGNDQGGKVSGSITINIKEGGCNPIIIDKLYGGGYEAGYSIYGYNKSDGSPRTKEEFDAAREAALAGVDESNQTAVNNALIEAGLFGFPKASPRINIISATKIGEVYGGGYNSVVVGNPTINVNMEEGQVLKEYVDKNTLAFTVGPHTLTTSYHEGGIEVEREDDYAVVGSVAEGLAAGNAILKTGTIGNIFGGGDQADVIGNTTVEIGTGSWFNPDTRQTETLERKAAFVLGNVYGGGRMGNVGNFTKTAGKPTSCVDGTGIARIIISNGEIGPDNMKMYHADSIGVIPANDKPDDSGHVFGGGMGTNAPADDNAAFVDSTEVIINGTAWVKGSVFGGGENGHVLHDAGVKIGGQAQIGNGHILVKDGSTLLVNQGINRRYTDAEWEAGRLILGDGDLPGVSAELKTSAQTMYANSLPECHSWEYKAPYAPYDKYAGTDDYDAKGAAKIATSGRAFNGNVFGGGSGFFPYEAGRWNPKAGQVEGDTWVEVTGGHIMTSLYGGSEMTSVTGDTHIIMSGGTVGVPRTLSEIAAHPVTCYVFGGGKGEERSYLDNVTTVNNAFVNVSGGWVYGSVFGGAEDGAVLGNAKVTIGGTTPSDTTTFAGLFAGSATKIGTWGTSYVDGNIFGGGRGYEGKNPKAGRVGGNINIDITGGRMLGSVYGGGRLGSVGIDSTGVMQGGDDHGIITINATGGIIGNDHEYTYSPDAALLSGTLKNTVFEDFTFKEKIADGESTTTVDEAADAVTIKKLYHTKGGSIYGGSMGRLTQLDGVTINPIWHQLGIAKATTINFSGNARVMSSLFGGSEFGKVIGDTHINVSGSSVIGTAVEKAGVPQYTFGSIYAGGYGSDYKLTDADKTAGATVEPRAAAGLVKGNTYLNMSENAKVLASVYGGGKLAVVDSSTTVTVSGGEVGLNLVRKGDGYVMFGGDGMGNVYGGGRGRLVDGGRDNGLGLVKGNTNVIISGGSIYHNVYGGGTLASVGTFLVSDGTTPSYIPFAGVPYDWTANTGTATVTVTGGTIGINGRDNGMVFGSSRGDLTLPVVEGGREIDPYDRMAWVNDSRVNIGTDGSPTGPHITGTVYGGGENGHNGHDATVNVYSGTVGIVDTADPWYSFADAEVNEKALLMRGNVYGAGCGTDSYTTKDGEQLHNPKAGMVGHSTTVNIHGGHIVRNVYGGGALGSVGMLSNDEGTKHDNAATSFALSWPYALEFAPSEDNGKATVNVTGGHIGLRQLDGGDIFGGARGEAGDRYATAHLAYVRESEVNVNYPSTPDLDALTYSGMQNDFSVPCITGSVHGSGENGFVYDDAHVNILNGLIGHSVYGGGKGKGTYTKRLSNIGGVTGKDGSDHHDAEIYSLIAGKVFGNTYVTMKNGRVGRNIYGGGNMGSVGKGNYAGGADDYFPSGYGETITGNLWTSEAVGDNAWHFLNSGNTHVKVFGGKVGYIDPTNPKNSMKNDLPYGNVFGGSAGEAAPNILDDPRYEYCPAFFSGYVNETNVAIGGYRCKAACTDKNGAAHAVDELLSEAEVLELFAGTSALADGKPSDEYWEKLTGPTILASVYGGGQEGHVRRDTHVRVTSGEIGLAYTDANRTLLKTGSLSMSDELNNPQWLYRGNVFGGGSGITKYAYDFDYDGNTTSTGIDYTNPLSHQTSKVNEEDYSSSAGSVTRFTQVDITGGTIHRNVYGGGSLASVGPPNLGQTYDPYQKGDTIVGHSEGLQSQCTVNIAGTIGSPSGYNKVYGGEVYGASRGITELKEKEDFSFTIWTQVNIFNGANIKGNVYGGGDTGIVKKNTEVNVGATRP